MAVAFLLLIGLGWGASARGQAARGVPLSWGSDAEGGAPYEFQDPRDPDRVIGFEVDLVEAIGRFLGRPTRFVQNQWDGLIPGLQRGNYDIVISGLEITPDRAQVISFSRPYYTTFEQLAVRSDDARIRSLDDCRGRSVGTLKGSLAQRILEARGSLDCVSYDGQVNAYEDLGNGRLDAVLMDHIIAMYNVVPTPRLKMVGPPVGRLEYGIGVRKDRPGVAGRHQTGPSARSSPPESCGASWTTGTCGRPSAPRPLPTAARRRRGPMPITPTSPARSSAARPGNARSSTFVISRYSDAAPSSPWNCRSSP